MIVLKGLLFYFTMTFVSISICCIDSMTIGMLLIDVLVICLLVIANYKCLNEEELSKITFIKYLPNDNEEENN